MNWQRRHQCQMERASLPCPLLDWQRDWQIPLEALQAKLCHGHGIGCELVQNTEPREWLPEVTHALRAMLIINYKKS